MRRSSSRRDGDSEYLQSSEPEPEHGGRTESPITVIPVVIDTTVHNQRGNDDNGDVRRESRSSRRGLRRQATTTLDIRAFQRELADLQEIIKVFADNVESLMVLHRNVLVAVTDREIARSECALENLIDETNQISRDIARKLRDLEPKSTANGVSRSDLDMMRIQHLSVTQRFVHHLQAYRRAQVTNRNTYVNRLTRQYRVVKPNATDDEIKAVVETRRMPIFTAAVLSTTARTPQARAALEDVEERHREILNLDNSLQELTLLYEHMEHLVEEDDEKLKDISTHVEHAGMDIERAGDEIAKAKERAEKIRKRQWIYGILLVLVLAVAVTGLVLGLTLR